MELIKSEEMIINPKGAKIVPFNIPSETKTFSLVEVVVDENGHGATKNTHTDRIIQIIDGEGVIVVADRHDQAKPGSVFAIPRDTYYDYYATVSNTLTVWVFDIPKFDPRYEISKK